jgi:hypothetical protein
MNLWMSLKGDWEIEFYSDDLIKVLESLIGLSDIFEVWGKGLEYLPEPKDLWKTETFSDFRREVWIVEESEEAFKKDGSELELIRETALIPIFEFYLSERHINKKAGMIRFSLLRFFMI